MAQAECKVSSLCSQGLLAQIEIVFVTKHDGFQNVSCYKMKTLQLIQSEAIYLTASCTEHISAHTCGTDN